MKIHTITYFSKGLILPSFSLKQLSKMQKQDSLNQTDLLKNHANCDLG